MNEFVVLADGTKVEDSYVVSLGTERIAVYVKGVHTFAEMSNLFCDGKKTEKMDSDQYGDKQTWLGFTTPTALQINETEAYVCLKKE